MKLGALATIAYRNGKLPGARHASGRLVFDEALLDGRLITRYWNSNGQVWPETHLERRKWRPDQPADVFGLAVNHRDLAGGWAWEGAELQPDRSRWRARPGDRAVVVHGVVRLIHRDAGIRANVHTRLDGSPFAIRWLEIENLNKTPVGITALAPWSGELWAHRFEEHVALERPSPFELGYNHQFEWGREGDFWFEPLADGRKAVDGGRKGRSGWGRPAFWARNLANGQTFVCELAWGGNYEFALDCRVRGSNWGRNQVRPSNREAELYFRMGLSGHNPVLRVLDPGETVETPSVHMALFQDGTDAIVQATHDHVRHVVMPAPIPGRHIEIEANHRGYLCDRENVPDICNDIDVAASLGAELYVIDAGWYGKEPNKWPHNVGDWSDGVWLKQGGGLKAIAAHARKRGMRFGLWVEIEAAGTNSDLKKNHPDWLLKRGGAPIQDGRALDLTQPAVARWAEGELDRLIRLHRLDMYRIDHNHCLEPSGNRSYKGFTEDLTWRYYDALYGIIDRLRARFPRVVFQNCAGGGGRLDWATLSRFHNTELSDWMRLPRAVKILSGSALSLPPEILLRTFGTEVGEHVLDGDADTQLRHCFCRVIFRGTAPSRGELTPYLRERVTHFVELYKSFLRPILVNCRVFLHTPFLPLDQPTPWCVLEYARPDRGTAAAAIFRTSAEPAGAVSDEYLFRPRGLDPARDYTVGMDNGGTTFRAGGAALVRDGIRIRLEQPLTSELVLFTAQSEGKRQNVRRKDGIPSIGETRG